MRDIVRLIRLPNLLFLGILVWVMEKWVAIPVLHSIRYDAILSNGFLVLLMVAMVCIAAGGYVINDYFDVKIDRINRPDRVIVTRTIDKQTAFRLSIGLSAVGLTTGIIAAILCRSWTVGILIGITPGLLWFYSSGYKRQFLIGNLIIALLSSFPPLIIAFANIGYAHKLYDRFGDIVSQTPLPHSLLVWLGGFAVFAFLTTWTREIIKDMQDQIGDAELECHTLPVVLGDTKTKIIVTALILLIIAGLSYCLFVLLPFNTDWTSLPVRYWDFGLMVPLVCLLILLWTAKIPSDYKAPQEEMKFIMFMGTLFSYVIFRMMN